VSTFYLVVTLKHPGSQSSGSHRVQGKRELALLRMIDGLALDDDALAMIMGVS